MARTTENVTHSRQVTREKAKALREHLRQTKETLETSVDLSGHIEDENNPHNNTKEDIDLGNVYNYPTAHELQIEEGVSNEHFLLSEHVGTAYSLHDETADEGISGIYRPFPISPREDMVSDTLVLNATPLAYNPGKKNLDPNYGTLKVREYAVKKIEEPWSAATIETSTNVMGHNWQGTLENGENYVWRCRDTNMMDQTTGWSVESGFIFAVTPPKPVVILNPPTMSEVEGDVTITVQNDSGNGWIVEVSDDEEFEELLYSGEGEGSTALLPLSIIGEGVRYVRVSQEGDTNYHVVAYQFTMGDTGGGGDNDRQGSNAVRLSSPKNYQVDGPVWEVAPPHIIHAEPLDDTDVLVVMDSDDFNLVRYNLVENQVVWAKKITINQEVEVTTPLGASADAYRLLLFPKVRVDEETGDLQLSFMQNVVRPDDFSYHLLRQLSEHVMTFDGEGNVKSYLDFHNITQRWHFFQPARMNTPYRGHRLVINNDIDASPAKPALGLVSYTETGVLDYYQPLLTLPSSFTYNDIDQDDNNIYVLPYYFGDAKIQGPPVSQYDRDNITYGLINTVDGFIVTSYDLDSSAVGYTYYRSKGVGGLVKPSGLTVDKDHNVYVSYMAMAENGDVFASVIKFDAELEFAGNFSVVFDNILNDDTPVIGFYLMAMAAALYVDETTDTLYVMFTVKDADATGVGAASHLRLFSLDRVEMDFKKAVVMEIGEDVNVTDKVLLLGGKQPYYVIQNIGVTISDPPMVISTVKDGASVSLVPLPLDMEPTTAPTNTLYQVKTLDPESYTLSPEMEIELHTDALTNIQDDENYQFRFLSTGVSSTRPPDLQVVDVDPENVNTETWEF